jgi:hypothetical protein
MERHRKTLEILLEWFPMFRSAVKEERGSRKEEIISTRDSLSRFGCLWLVRSAAFKCGEFAMIADRFTGAKRLEGVSVAQWHGGESKKEEGRRKKFFTASGRC